MTSFGQEFLLLPNQLYLNHGSYGATPQAVLDAQISWKKRMERQPYHFMHRILPQAYQSALNRAARFIRADVEGLAFVPNATTGCNAVFQNIRFEPGDEVLTTSHRYDAVFNALQRHTNHANINIVVVDLPISPSSGDILERLKSAATHRTGVARHRPHASATASLFPVHDVTQAFQKMGIQVLIDAAHAPGQIDIDISTLAPDYWTGNLHKWCCAPKGSALLYVSKPNREHFNAPIISHGYGKGFREEMGWMGTADYSSLFSLNHGIGFT